MRGIALAVLDAQNRLGVHLFQQRNDVVRQAHAADLRYVIQVQPEPVQKAGVGHAIDHVAVAIDDAFVRYALDEKRRQHQAAVYAGAHGVARQSQCFRQGGATGRDHDLRGRNTVFDQLVQRVLALGHRERRAFASGAKRRHAFASAGQQLFAVRSQAAVVNAQVGIEGRQQGGPDTGKRDFGGRVFKDGCGCHSNPSVCHDLRMRRQAQHAPVGAVDVVVQARNHSGFIAALERVDEPQVFLHRRYRMA